MKASWNWLRAFLPGLDADPKAVSQMLTMVGLEVEGLHEFGAGLDPIVVAEVRAFAPHPARSSLRLVTVDRGGVTQQIVCGAPNVPDPGGLVVLAPLGTHLPAKGLTLEAKAIGGIVSEGMLCSEVELGIGSAEGGILILPPGSAKPGQKFIDAFPSAHDWIFEIGVTPNRPDALGHLGIARDLAALTGLPLNENLSASEALTSWGWQRASQSNPVSDRSLKLKSDRIRVVIEDAERCAHYSAAQLSTEVATESPMWLRHRLFSLGIRPISPLVDITNYMLLERAQPMHAFDRRQIRGGVIRVRRATNGEKLVLLDGQELSLVDDDLVIADAERPLALAGVMGGKDSGVAQDTNEIVLEVAYFDARSIRRSARRHGLHTESSHRFERGIDRNGVRSAISATAARIVDLFVDPNVASETAIEHVEPKAWQPPVISLRSHRLNQLLGVDVPFADAIKTLKSLGCSVLSESTSDGVLAATLSPPSWRPDLGREADLIEEIARIRGLDSIPAVLPAFRPQPPRTTGHLENRLRKAAVELGLSEAIPYSFTSEQSLHLVGAPAAAVSLKHPLSEDRNVMRTSLLPGLLEALSLAKRRGENSSRLFCLGHVFFAAQNGSLLPVEERHMAVVLSGPRPAYLSKSEDHDAFDAKAIAIELVERVTGQSVSIQQLTGDKTSAPFHPRAYALIECSGVTVGSFGLLHPAIQEKLDVSAAIAVVQLNIEALQQVGHPTTKCKPIPRLPAISRDVNLVVHDNITSGQVSAMMKQLAGDLCSSVELFDIFRGGSVPTEHRSLTFRMMFRDPKDAAGLDGARTLTDAEVDERRKVVVDEMQKRLGAVLRG